MKGVEPVLTNEDELDDRNESLLTAVLEQMGYYGSDTGT